MTRSLTLGSMLVLCLIASAANAEYTLRFAPPLGYSQDFDVQVEGSASARGKDIEFRGTIKLNQTMSVVPDDETQPLTATLTITEGSIRYGNKEKAPRYVGQPFSAERTRLGVITSISEPLTDNEDTGIDVTAAILYATSLLALPEKPIRPGKGWDGSHDAFDPYNDFVEVKAENTFADLIELPDCTLIDVSSEGSFDYRAEVDARLFYGTLEYILHSKMDLDTCALRESDLVLKGGLKTRGPLATTVNITVHELHVHATEISHKIVDVSQMQQGSGGGAQEQPNGQSDQPPSPPQS
jgi:hypothetical protein